MLLLTTTQGKSERNDLEHTPQNLNPTFKKKNFMAIKYIKMNFKI